MHRNANVHSGEPDEGQQSLFSWAEFTVEEPGEAKGPPPAPAPARMPSEEGRGSGRRSRSARGRQAFTPPTVYLCGPIVLSDISSKW